MDFIQSITERLSRVSNLTFSGIGSVVGIVGDITLMTMPVILYYLLKMVIKLFLQYVYSRHALQHKISVMLHEMNQQVISHIFVAKSWLRFLLGLLIPLDIRLSDYHMG